MYCCLWEFVVRPGRVEEFERRCGPRGEWSALFRRHPGYVRTDLLRDARNERRYVTLDLWDTRESFLEFRARHRNEYERLDSALEELTEKEAALGEFEVL